jgi:hypothetical protein
MLWLPIEPFQGAAGQEQGELLSGFGRFAQLLHNAQPRDRQGPPRLLDL